MIEKFQLTPPSSVKPETFKVLYSSFEIDITKIILNLAKVSETGINVQETSLPKGKYKLLMVMKMKKLRRLAFTTVTGEFMSCSGVKALQTTISAYTSCIGSKAGHDMKTLSPETIAVPADRKGPIAVKSDWT